MKVIILCGGQGTRLREETEYKPKPMVEIGGKPILWHIMKVYSHYGINEFVLALGYRGNDIRDFFLNYEFYNNDFTIDVGSNDIKIHSNSEEANWKITLVETGDKNITGSRIKKCQKYINEDQVMVTYGDGIGNINIRKLLEFHNSHGKMGTITGVNPHSRFGELIIDGRQIIKFTEKPISRDARSINGGFMVFDSKFFSYLSEAEDCSLEYHGLYQIAYDGQLMMHHHDGFWHSMDTYRDYLALNRIWESEDIPWFNYMD